MDCDKVKYKRYEKDGLCQCSICSDQIELMIKIIKQFPMNFTHIALKNELCEMVEMLTGLTESDIGKIK